MKLLTGSSDCESSNSDSDLNDYFLFLLIKEGLQIQMILLILLLLFVTNILRVFHLIPRNYSYFHILILIMIPNDSIFTFKKIGVTNSALSITASISVSVLKQFPTRPSQYYVPKWSIQHFRQLVTKVIYLPAWHTYYSKTYNLFQLSSFTEEGCKFPKPCYIAIGRKIRSRDPSLSLPNYFMYGLFECVNNFCITHLYCCTFFSVTSHCHCTDTVIVMIISFDLVLNYFDGYMILLLLIT